MSVILREVSRRARRLQFRLRGLFLAITICGVWLGTYAERAREKRAAIQAIRAEGGRVFYDVHKYVDVSARPHWPDWLLNSLGEDFLRTVVQVELDRNCDDSSLAHVAKLADLEEFGVLGPARVTDVGMARLGGLTRLTAVRLSSPELTNDSLRILGKLPRLITIDLPGISVSDAGLAHLQGNPELLFLDLGGSASGVTDDGMTSLARSLKLEVLNLDGANIGSKGVEQLKGLTKLQSLTLSNTRIGDEGLRCIAHLSQLEELGLRNTNVTSQGLANLKRLSKLRILDLSENRDLSDEGIAYLSQLTNIEELNLHATAVTSDGVWNLQRLAKLKKLDLSENGAITEDALNYVGKLHGLTNVDLHNTRVGGKGSANAEKLRHLQELPSLSLLDLSGTGARTRQFNAPPNCRVIGSRARDIVPAGMEIAVSHELIRGEVDAIAHNLTRAKQFRDSPVAPPQKSDRCGEYVQALTRFLPERAPESTLRRMAAVSKVAVLDSRFRKQRPLIEEFLRRVSCLPYADYSGRARVFSEVLVTAKCNLWLRRLYAAASDLELADALHARIQYLDGVKEQWALTDVECDDYNELPGLLRVCLDDACAQLGLRGGAPSDKPPDELAAIREQTSAPPKKRPYVSCWRF